MKRIIFISILILLSSTSISYAQERLIILHSNDTHSQIEPLPSSDKYYPNRGGLVNRKAVIDSIRKIEKNVLLIDVGDFVQGTPYYNLFHGKVETEGLNRMKYDVGTIGNHEFDEGLDSLKMLVNQLDFPIINCNYDFSKTVLHKLIKPYVILNKGGIKIGIIGVGAGLEGLVQKTKSMETTFLPISESVNYYAQILRKQKKCDLIICVSHIGYDEDRILATKSEDVDIIIGGHSHTFMEQPDMQKNKNGKDVFVYQAASKGVFVGQIVVELKK